MQPKVIIKLIIHFLFWIFYIVVLFVFDPLCLGDLNIYWVDRIETKLLILVASIIYVNDLLLLPYFLKKKNYISYTLIAVAVLALSTYYYCYYLVECIDDLFTCYSSDLWIIALPFIFLSFIWVVLEFFENQKELEKMHNDKIELELKLLKLQINPHVLFNNLNTIYSKAVNENEVVAELILMLSENLKYVLNQSQDKLVALENDITYIENYLKFQELRTQGVNNIMYKSEIDSYDHTIAPLILIDFIENAFKHSIYQENKLCDIDISIIIRDGILQFICMNEFDDSIAVPQITKTKIGIENLTKRLRLIYKNKYALKINKNNGVFKVELNIDLR